MKYIDISLPLTNGTLTHPSEDFFKIEPSRNLAKDGVATSKITIGSHSGTHIDAPAHFIKDGKGVDKLEFEKLFGPCQVLEVNPEEKLITRENIEGKINSARVLFKTPNSKIIDQPYTKDYLSLSLEAAQYLVEQKVTLVGTDYIAIEASGSPGHPVHTKLLENEIVIVEGLNLTNVNAGTYELIVLPLRLKDLDGSPARAVLIKN